MQEIKLFIEKLNNEDFSKETFDLGLNIVINLCDKIQKYRENEGFMTAYENLDELFTPKSDEQEIKKFFENSKEEIKKNLNTIDNILENPNSSEQENHTASSKQSLAKRSQSFDIRYTSDNSNFFLKENLATESLKDAKDKIEKIYKQLAKIKIPQRENTKSLSHTKLTQTKKELSKSWPYQEGSPNPLGTGLTAKQWLNGQKIKKPPQEITSVTTAENSSPQLETIEENKCLTQNKM